MKRFLHDNGLSLVLFSLFLVTLLAGQSLAGLAASNQELRAHGEPAQSLGQYLRGPGFWEATMENWESEFLQMAVYVLLTVFLVQRGSAESKDPDKVNEVDRDPRRSRHDPKAPWPVRRGGLALRLYESSLSIALLTLFLVSFVLHGVYGAREYNEEQQRHGEPPIAIGEYFVEPRFWFESFQNWQSELLAIGAMVTLTIHLRQRGSPESKPVDAAHSETGG